MKATEDSRLVAKLRQAGWYEGRRIRGDSETSWVENDLPEKVGAFLREFGDLTLRSDQTWNRSTFNGPSEERFCTDLEVFGQRMLNPIDAKSFEASDYFDPRKPIHWEEDAQYYYYSVLIGTNLFCIAWNQTDSSLGIYMDEWGNFYEIDHLGELTWFAREPFEALEILLLLTQKPRLGFDATLLEWFEWNGTVAYRPPVNPNLTSNPWDKKDGCEKEND